jgi:putative oxidoreductase
MKQQIKHIPAYLLALVFVVFGLNFFLNFIPMQTMPGDAGTFAGLLYTSGYLKFVKILEVVIGLLLIVPKTRALALLLIAPIVINILLFEVYLAHQPGIGVVLTIVNALGIYLNREKYMSIIS